MGFILELFEISYKYAELTKPFVYKESYNPHKDLPRLCMPVAVPSIFEFINTFHHVAFKILQLEQALVTQSTNTMKPCPTECIQQLFFAPQRRQIIQTLSYPVIMLMLLYMFTNYT